LLLSPGCVTLERSYPEKHFFVLEIGAVKPVDAPRQGVLQISSVRISPRYEGKNFIYRLSDTSYESDFYNEFLIAPATLVTEELVKGLTRAAVFEHVIDSSSQLSPTYALEAAVNALYGDFRNGSAPKAVVEMEFFVTKETAGKSEILMQKRYSKAAGLGGRSADALVKGWDQALDEILADLVVDLKAARF
jgi:ABC-type uncharacterized transport system auxiliary subunit